jgi:transcription elongation GreA/GreB family factor
MKRVLQCETVSWIDVDKRALLDALRERLTAELERARGRAREAAEGATHEENRAEGDKDMRSTEASYVARGHSTRVLELEGALGKLKNMALPKRLSTVAISALVELEHEGRRLRYFIVPAAGGERLRAGNAEVQTLTSVSPLGAALLGLGIGDEAEVASPGAVDPRVYEIVDLR